MSDAPFAPPMHAVVRGIDEEIRTEPRRAFA